MYVSWKISNEMPSAKLLGEVGRQIPVARLPAFDPVWTEVGRFTSSYRDTSAITSSKTGRVNLIRHARFQCRCRCLGWAVW